MKRISTYDNEIYYDDLKIDPDNHFLESVDPYGTTYFSYEQLRKFVIPELQKIENDPRIKSNIKNLVVYLQGIESHAFCQILGD